MSQKGKFRKFINDIHLWLGIGSGIILFIVCLTGTIYTFKSEIEYTVNPQKFDSSAYQEGKKVLSPDEIISAVQKQEKGKISYLIIPENAKKNYEFGIIKKKKDKKGNLNPKNVENKKASIDRKQGKDAGSKKVRPAVFYVDPYSGKVVAKADDATNKFFMIVMKLHRWLLLDDSIGRPVVGISTIIFIVLCLSGLILWLPRKFRHWKRWFYWKPGFKIKFNAKWKRINHDLHNTLGFYSLIFLLIMGVTGLCWSFDWYREGLSKLMGSEVFAARTEKSPKIKNEETAFINLAQIKEISDKELSYPGDLQIGLVRDSTSAVKISKSKNGFFALSSVDKIYINPYSGKVIKKDLFSDKPLNVQITSLIRDLHLGNVMGTFSKIIYFISCLIGTSLPVTGVMIWLNKMKKSSSKK